MIISKQNWKLLQDAHEQIALKWNALQQLRQKPTERKAVVSAEMQYLQALQTLNSLIQASITPQTPLIKIKKTRFKTSPLTSTEYTFMNCKIILFPILIFAIRHLL